MKLTPTYLAAIFGVAAVAIAGSFAFLTLAPKPPLDIEVIRNKEATGGVEIEFIRIKITNNSGRDLTNVLVKMGKDDVQQFAIIASGQSIFVTPKEPNKVSRIEVNTNEGISATEHA